ncbi:unnamed protein product [Dicrocoelium dendriticum]|nr:unnamed protein product [Dicrocoelium dendriticum]
MPRRPINCRRIHPFSCSQLSSRLGDMISNRPWCIAEHWDSSATIPAVDGDAVDDRSFASVVNEDSLSTVPMCELSECYHNSKEELSFGFYLNSRLPPVDDIAPFSPLYASSPRPLLDEVVEKARHVEAGTQCLSALTTSPPPTLSLLGATDSFLADKTAIEFPTPPCLSFYG